MINSRSQGGVGPDVSTDGTIGSEFMASPHIQYVGIGEHQAFVRQGWMGRTMNKLWPF